MSGWQDIRIKVVSSIVAAVVIAAGAWAVNWASSNVVFASDLEGLAEMMGRELAEQIRPLAKSIEETNALAQRNADDIKQGRIEATRADIRDLRKEIKEMEDRRARGMEWTSSDARLLEEWQNDLEDLQRLLGTLEGSQ